MTPLIIPTFWKNVLGVYTEDPLKSAEAQLLGEIPYSTYHNLTKDGDFPVRPDAMETLEQIKVTSFVRSFINLTAHGTRIYI